MEVPLDAPIDIVDALMSSPHDPRKLRRVFTHIDNRDLAWVGDAVLKTVVTRVLIREHGGRTIAWRHAVREALLTNTFFAYLALEYRLVKYLTLPDSEHRAPPSIEQAATAFEALVGALAELCALDTTEAMLEHMLRPYLSGLVSARAMDANLWLVSRLGRHVHASVLRYSHVPYGRVWRSGVWLLLPGRYTEVAHAYDLSCPDAERLATSAAVQTVCRIALARAYQAR